MANSTLYVFLTAIVAMMINVINGFEAETYDFVVKSEKKNISCFDCNNYSFNVTEDRHKFAVLNEYCEKNPGKVKHFKKHCSPDKHIGCATTKTTYQQYSRNPAKRVVYQIRRYCIDRLLPKCQVSEGSRGEITICTCTSNYCNAANGIQVALTGIFLPIAAALTQFRHQM